MRFYIEDWCAWINGPEIPFLREIYNKNIISSFDDEGFPMPERVPKPQRRRLSAFSRIALSQIEKISGVESLPTVFSTRHGDLPKTVGLLKSVAIEDELSPTKFALSVHNAVSGQFGIHYNNSSPSNVVSAGRDSFLMGLIDAVSRLNFLECEEILLVHGDMPLPAPYETFTDEIQLAHCVVIKLVRNPSNIVCSLTRSNVTSLSDEWSRLPQAIQAAAILSGQKPFDCLAGRTCWEFKCE